MLPMPPLATRAPRQLACRRCHLCPSAVAVAAPWCGVASPMPLSLMAAPRLCNTATATPGATATTATAAATTTTTTTTISKCYTRMQAHARTSIAAAASATFPSAAICTTTTATTARSISVRGPAAASGGAVVGTAHLRGTTCPSTLHSRSTALWPRTPNRTPVVTRAAPPPPFRTFPPQTSNTTATATATGQRTPPAAGPTTRAPPPPRPTRRRPPPPSPQPPPSSTAPSAATAPTVLTAFPAHLQPEVLANGLLLVDKPVGWEVLEVVATVQRATRAAKVASVAPLDPGASGLVLLCFGAATRLARAVERGVKVYEGSMVLGAAAESADVRGGSFRPAAMPWGHIEDDLELQEAADSLLLTADPAAPPPLPSPPGGPPAVPPGPEGGGAQHPAGSSGGVPASGSGGGGGAVLQVLPPRFKPQQLPGSSLYVEEDVGANICTSPLRVHSFRVWTDPTSAQPAPQLPPTAYTHAADGRHPSSRLNPLVGRGRGGGGGGGGGRTVRFSVALSGRIQLRSLVAMYGRRLRTTACLDELRRTEVAGLSVEDAWSLEALLPVLRHYRG